MAYRFSLNPAKAQLGSKARAEGDAKELTEKQAVDKVMADVQDEHGHKKNILGDDEPDTEINEEVFVPTGSKRHYAGRQKSTKSGPGTLMPDPMDGFGAPPGRYGFSSQPRHASNVPSGPSKVDSLKVEEDVFSRMIAKASNLPPDMDTRQLEELFATYSSLKVVNIEKITPQGPPPRGRPTLTMKVTFDKNADNKEFNKALTDLNDKKYLGSGYYLHLDRYLGGGHKVPAEKPRPFGATWEPKAPAKGFAPPESLGGSHRDQPSEEMELVVRVHRPPDLAMIRLIHLTVEGTIEGGVEFEAALMNDPRIQKDERFAFLYDSNHPNAKYYRLKLYETLTGEKEGEVYEGLGFWRYADAPLKDEFADQLSALSVDTGETEFDEEDEKPQRGFDADADYPGRDNSGHGYMDPRSRTLLIYLLSSPPEAADKSVSNEQVAAISNVAVEYVTSGMGEVIDLLVSNIIQPFVLSEEDDETNHGRTDVQQATLNALYVVSDVLMTTYHEGGACYKYREAVGVQLQNRKVFEYLEKLPVQLEFGLMTRDKYRKDVNAVLALWTKEHMFNKSVLETMDTAFNEPERKRKEAEMKKKQESKGNATKKETDQKNASVSGPQDGMDADADGTTNIPSLDGANDERTGTDTPVSEGSDVASNQEDDQNEKNGDTDEDVLQDTKSGDSRGDILQGTKPGATREDMLQDTKVGDSHGNVLQEAKTGNSRGNEPKESPVPEAPKQETAAARARRLRPKAEDMFASDGE